jgi:hypothetical protein
MTWHPTTARVMTVALQQASKALREGVAAEQHWHIVAGALDVACAIERAGCVRGLREHLASTAQALQAIRARALQGTAWRSTPLHYCELDALGAFVDLHGYQLRQLNRARQAQMAARMAA